MLKFRSTIFFKLGGLLIKENNSLYPHILKKFVWQHMKLYEWLLKTYDGYSINKHLTVP